MPWICNSCTMDNHCVNMIVCCSTYTERHRTRRRSTPSLIPRDRSLEKSHRLTESVYTGSGHKGSGRFFPDKGRFENFFCTSNFKNLNERKICFELSFLMGLKWKVFDVFLTLFLCHFLK